MSPISGRAPLDRIDRAVIAGAAAVLLLPIGLVATSLTVVLTHAVQDALTREPLCPARMSIAVTSRGDIACLTTTQSLPRGWSLIYQGD
jgi:hypothetical protein